MRYILTILAASFMAACATTPVSVSDAAPVPKDRMFAFASTGDGNTVIVVTRDKGYTASGCGITVSIDKTDAAFLGTGEKAVLHVPTGDHILAARPSEKGLCAIGAKAQYRTLKFTADKGHQPEFRIAILSSGDISLTQTAL